MKRLLIGLLVAVLLLSPCGCGSQAEDGNTAATTTAVASTGEMPTFAVDSATAKRGETFTVAVRTENNPGIVSLKLAVEYDAAALELIEAVEQDFADVSYGPTTKVPFIVNWLDALSPDNATNGNVTLLVFRVREDAPVGATSLTLSYDPEDVFNAAMDGVLFDTRSAQVTVTE